MLCDPWTPVVVDKGQLLIIPHLFDGTNYAYWKVSMRAFLQSLDEKVWQAMEIGWTKPKEAPTNWDDAKIKAANFNIWALNAKINLVCLSSRAKTKGRRMLGIIVNTLFPQD